MYISRAERRRRRLVDWPRATLAASRALREGRRWRRLARWATNHSDYAAPEVSTLPGEQLETHFERVVALERCGGDPLLERGKRRNVALAAAALNGRQLEPGSVFSFWRTIGRPSRARGYELGAEVRGGCIVPTTGGGLCLIANALFEAAVTLGWVIHERHGHTVATVGDPQELDATIAWPDVDLRLEPRGRVVLTTEITSGTLVVRVLAASRAPALWRVEIDESSRAAESGGGAIVRDIVRRSPSGRREWLGRDHKRLEMAPTLRPNCFTCGETACHGRPRDMR